MGDLKAALDGVVDYESAMDRFDGNEKLYERILKQFESDKNIGVLRDSLAAGDADAAFRAAHSLRGVAGTLDLHILYGATAPVVEALRVGNVDAARELMGALEAAYEKAQGKIAAYFAGQ